MIISRDSFGTEAEMEFDDGRAYFFSLSALAERLRIDITTLPITIRILLENQLRNEDGILVTPGHIESLAGWRPGTKEKADVPFLPARVLMQDFTGVPSVVDLAAMRDAMEELGGDPDRITPLIPVDLVIDHSVQVDRFGTAGAFAVNEQMELERNRERYAFLKWGQKNLDNFNVVPPATGICHQVNLEYLAKVVAQKEAGDKKYFFPDTLLGLDSHTTMINGIGVLGWGVGGIEAEAVMLGQPYYFLTPEVIGFELTGRMPEAATATDLVLTITKMMREKGVVGKFIEFYGEGLPSLTLPDRATIANMTPEFGATATYFPVDRQTIDYLSFTGRPAAHVRRIEKYLSIQGMFYSEGAAPPVFTDTMHLDLGDIEPSVAGPIRPHERIPLSGLKADFSEKFENIFESGVSPEPNDENWEQEGGAVTGAGGAAEKFVYRKTFDEGGVPVNRPYESFYLEHGSVVIAAITSCTNTSNPGVLMGAGLLAKKAVQHGLGVRPWVKTSLAPGSKVVVDYLEAAGLMPYLQALGFHLVAYGCTTCIGNSGPLYPDVARKVEETGLVVASVLSGNRNFEGRINSLTRANYLASPMLVVAFALAGTVNIDMERDPLRHDPNAEPVYLRDIWPTQKEINEAMAFVDTSMFLDRYANVYEGDENWKGLPAASGRQFLWDGNSTYIQAPPFFRGMTREMPDVADINGARVLALLGDSITTDHISPAGTIPEESPAGQFLLECGVKKSDFNSYGSRRGNHHVMVRGTFANVRLANQLAAGKKGGWTLYVPDGEVMTICDAAEKYRENGIPLIIVAGKAYGSGSSRDWAAKGTMLLGVRAVIAESFERIHRSNLVAMGVLPLEFREGESAASLGLTGREAFSLEGLSRKLSPYGKLDVTAAAPDGATKTFTVTIRLDSRIEMDYYRHGGILQYVMRKMLAEKPDS
ncbi:MAG: aconitate hydratase AcnA [Desulfosalsimonadaceae bacterium]